VSLTRLLVVLAIVTTPALARAQDETDASEAESSEEASEEASEGTSDADTEKEDATSPPDKDEGGEETPGGDEEAFGHMGQWGLRAGLVGGMHVVFRYDKGNSTGSPYCKKPDFSQGPEDQANNCGFAAPFATEIALSFAPLDAVEPYLFTRLGFVSEKNTNTDPLVMLGAGVRLYTMSDSAFKIFIEPGIAWELESGGDNPEWTYNGAFNPEYKKDLVFHLGIGPHYDFSKNIGMFLGGNIDVGILRAIHAWMLFNLGVQGRYP